MRTLVTGGTGLVGSHLVPRLEDAVVLARSVEGARSRFPRAKVHAWDGLQAPPPLSALDAVHAIVHLAGEPLAARRWSEQRKRTIRDSRVRGTQHLVQALVSLGRRPSVLVSASAIGYYGDRGNTDLDENASPGTGFLPDVCVAWEREAQAAEALGIRVVCVRFGMIMAREGGALPRLLAPFKLGLGGRIGDGKQWVSWIHVDDAVGILQHVIADETIRGPVNAVAPVPVTNAELTRLLGQALHRPVLLPVPKLAIRLAMGEMSQVVTDSQRVVPAVVLRSGYRFAHPDLDGSLPALVGSHRSPDL